jgi:replicative DNA helicase
MNNKTNNFCHIKDVLVSVFDEMQNKATKKGLSTGFSSIDNIITGMYPGDLILIGARPGMGKTAFAMNIAMNVSYKDKTVVVFSLEISKGQIASRILASDAFVDHFKLRGVPESLSDEEWVKIIEAGARLSECDLYFDDTPGITVRGMREKLREISKPDLVIIDYLQLIQSENDGENRIREISEISRDLKSMATEFDVPVIVCTQLARGPETRKDKRPMLSDLRASGAIEQAADVVMFLYRDAYYKTNIENHNRAEIIFVKNRHGAIGQVELGFEQKFTRFYEIDIIHQENI